MSPAGIHHKGRVTAYMHYIGLMFKNVLPKFVDHVAIPDFTFDIVEKLQKDLFSWPASADLSSYLSSLILGGKATGDNKYFHNSGTAKNILKFGCSLNVSTQIVQLY